MKLGINTGFALNRYPMPEQWGKIIGEKLNLRYVQLTADLINPSLGCHITKDLINRINKEKERYGLVIDSVMTGAFTRTNHFSHPDKNIRKYWKEWFKKLADIAIQIEANNLSSHFGIFCYEDFHNQKKREFMLNETVIAWKDLAEYGKKIGLKYLSWEPMSIKREYGETIEETIKINDLLKGSAIPIYLCLDVGHCHQDPDDPDSGNYRKWVEKLGKISPLVHIKQVVKGDYGHHPFIREYNKRGQINTAEFLPIMKKFGFQDPLLLLELSFREREPVDSLVLEQLIESVNYWRDAMKHDKKI